jgi:hypothetical protein
LGGGISERGKDISGRKKKKEKEKLKRYAEG